MWNKIGGVASTGIGFVRRPIALIVGVCLVVLFFVMAGSLWENVPANEIVVIQHPINGTLKWCIAPGLYWQGFGAPTHYPRSYTFWFSAKPDQGKRNVDQSMKTRFYDGGHGNISGSVQIDMPLSEKELTELHIRFHGPEGIEQNLIRTVFEKSVYMSGPLMSSKESYAEKRPILIFYIEDQALHGVYQTTTQDVRQKDPLTGVERTITLTKIIEDPKAPGGMARQEESPLVRFGLRAYNMNINSIEYNKVVEDQILTQQEGTMAVQTAMINAKKAEQDAITVTETGKANAARAKWEQEMLKAKAVTLAAQEFEVAEWARKAAEQTKQRDILLGEGESKKRQLLMAADNQLEIKLKYWLEANKFYADAVGKHTWVPQIQMGATTGAPGSAAADLVNLLTAKTAKELGLDMTMPKAQHQQ